MRFGLIFSLLLLAAVVFGVYHVEQRVEHLRAELVDTNRKLKESKEQIHVLNAEWSYLNQPARLQAMADRHLALETMSAGQVKDIADIPMRPVMVGSR